MRRTGLRILVPVDGSRASALALPRAVEFATRLGGDITLVGVNDPLTANFKRPKSEVVPSAVDRSAADQNIRVAPSYGSVLNDSADSVLVTNAPERYGALEYLSSLAADMKSHGFSTQTVVKTGQARECIVGMVANGQYDFVCMASTSTQAQRWMGEFSTTAGVVAHSQVPVCVVGPNETSVKSNDFQIVSRLFLLLMCEGDDAACDFAIGLARGLSIGVTPVCVCNSWLRIAFRTAVRKDPLCNRSSWHQRILLRLHLEGVAEGTETLINCGVPGTVEQLSRLPGSACVMGLPGNNPAAVATFGSIIQRSIRKSRAPLFIVPSSGQANGSVRTRRS